jgi:curved DNA-binding protein CbpA
MATKICADFDPYALLHVPYNATEQCIQSAYRQQARVWHPDKNPSNIEQGAFYAFSSLLSLIICCFQCCSERHVRESAQGIRHAYG